MAAPIAMAGRPARGSLGKLVYRTQLTKSPHLGTPRNINDICTSLESTFSVQQFRRWKYRSILKSLVVVASQTREVAQNSEKIRTSRSSKVEDFGTNRKRIRDFLLVIDSNFCPILHLFWDRAMKIAYFSHPSVIRRPAPYLSFGISRRS